MASQQTKFRNVCFTINNPTADDFRWCESVECKYIVWARERGESGTPHIQGYIEFNGRMYFTMLKRECPRGHFEPRRGSAKQARDYCLKEGDARERGSISRQGARTDLSEVCHAISEGDDLRAIARDFPEQFVKYERGIRALREQTAKARDFRPTVVWLWGASGCGKTREATACESYYIKDNTRWWNGYDHQARIILDDFDRDSWNFRDLLQLLDRYACRREIKGGYVEINSPEIYVTCEFAPSTLWRGSELEQITRRCAEIREPRAPVLACVTYDSDPELRATFEQYESDDDY